MDSDPLGTTMRWFGRPWGAAFNVSELQIPSPHAACDYCMVLIADDESGVAIPKLGAPGHYSYYHRRCFLESIGISPQ